MLRPLLAFGRLNKSFLEVQESSSLFTPPSRRLCDRIFALLVYNISHFRHKDTLPRVSAVQEYAGIDLCWPCGLHMRFYDDIVPPNEFRIHGTFRLTFGSNVVSGLMPDFKDADFHRFIALAFPLSISTEML